MQKKVSLSGALNTLKFDMTSVKPASMLPFVVPALATMAAKPPKGERWLHEIKFDGYRLQARIEAGRVKLLTRSGLDWTKKFGPELVGGIQSLPVGSAVLDGELVVESKTGASNFSALQAALSSKETAKLVFYVFDLLYLDGFDMRSMPLWRRKEVLSDVLVDCAANIKFSDHFEEDGDLVLEHACRLSLEGIISKVRDAPYRSGRSRNWMKSKCSAKQEFVIGGYTISSTSRKAIGSLVLGVYSNGRLRRVGRVGTGFTVALSKELFAKLERLRTDESPFSGKAQAPARYVRPELVAEVDFRGWTSDGSLRHASFKGLRDDRKAINVVMEKGTSTWDVPKLEQRSVRFTHADRIYWPEDGVTKEGLADYYADVWKYMAPYVVSRPLSLLRGPSGIDGQLFFQKHAWKGLSSHIDLVKDKKSKSSELLIGISDLDGLMALVQSAVLEIHPWGSTFEDWEHPDTIIMDLDPGPGVAWQAVIDAAFDVRARLDTAGLNSFVKTSGGKGLHVVAPLSPRAPWSSVKSFTKAMADSMARDNSDKYVSTITKSKRSGKILIDYLRNQRGATAVAPYSSRARPGASVSMPLFWEELSSVIGPDHFTVSNAPSRMAALQSDPWADFRTAAQPLRL